MLPVSSSSVKYVLFKCFGPHRSPVVAQTLHKPETWIPHTAWNDGSWAVLSSLPDLSHKRALLITNLQQTSSGRLFSGKDA